jgi:hypothetical protein
MKDLLKDGFRFFFISVEIVVVLIVTAVYLRWPEAFQPVGLLLTSKGDVKIAMLLIGLPISGIIYGYTLAKELMTPHEVDNDTKKAFYNWPGYQKLRNRVLFAIGLCIIGFLANIALWLASNEIDSGFTGFLYALVNAIWFVSILSLAIANLTLKAILSGRR